MAEPVNELVGRQGRAMTLLRPAGRAEFDGERVEVISVAGNRVVVRRTDTQQTEDGRTMTNERFQSDIAAS